MPSIGIDFGTTNSLMVAYDKKKNEFLYFKYDNNKPVPTSSTVWFHDNNIIVGKEARDNILKYNETEGHYFEKSIKLKLGKEYSSEIFGVNYSASDIASLILESLKKGASDVLENYISNVDINNAVMTVPINFSGKARKDLRDAANKSGIEVSTFIHEPFAAIIGYYFTKDKNNSFSDIVREIQLLEKKYVLVFDWGGGTLDITIVMIDNGKMIEVGTAELTGKAGDCFDEEIALWAWFKFIDKIGNKYTPEYLENIRIKKWNRLMAIAEKCKIELSSESESMFLLENVIPNEDEEIYEVLTRKEFGKLIERYIELSCNKIDEALKISGLATNNIFKVLMVGGTSNIPSIQDKLREKFGHRVEFLKNADLAIAQGAAVISEMGWIPFLAKDILIELSDGSFYKLFENGLPLVKGENPKISETFTCVDQRNKFAKLIICDGYNQENDSTLGIINVPILSSNRFGDDIDVNASIDNNIILHIKSNSKMINDLNSNISKQKSLEVHKLCFGLECKGGEYD